MAKGLLRWGLGAGLLCLAQAAAGCLLPQDDRVLPDVPSPKNRAPRIIPLRPEKSVLKLDNTGSCPPVDFEAAVEDYESSKIYARWFLRAQASDGTYDDRAKNEQALAVGTNHFTTETAKQSLQRTGAGELATAGNYIVELVAADGALVGRDPQPQALADGGTETTYAVTYDWFVTVVGGTCN